jgi:DNA anti-recombination protein RmuC
MAALTLANERNRLLEEFRAQLQTEAAGTIERVIETSKEDLARRALKVLNEASEATVRSSHERLIGAIEQDVENAKQRMLVQGNELGQRVDSMTTRTIEQLQRTLETSRTEAAARFVSRLREQVAPVLQEAKADLQKLVASQSVFKEESQAIYARVTSELESSVNTRLLQTHDDLDKNSALVLSECNDKLLELSQTFENVARDSVQTLIASATDDAKKDLEGRAAEISNIFTDHLEGHVRNYLEFIGESIAEFPKKTPAS